MQTTTSGRKFLYEDLHDLLSGMIRGGAFPPGEKLPSIRRLSLQKQMSISTVMKAYMLLEEQGVIESRPQSGFYVRSAADLPEEPARTSGASHPVEVKGDAKVVVDLMKASRIPGIVPLGAASPSPQLFPTRRMRRVLSGVFQRLGDEVNVYDVAPGREEFRKLIAQRAIEKGARLRPDDIIATCGCLEALHLSLRAVSKPGEMVAVENPTYFGILQVLEALGLRAVEIPTDPRTGMDLDAFRKALRTRKLAAAVVMPNFHNPLGSKMPDAHKKELVSLAATRNLPLIEDDIYGDLYYTGPRPRTLKSYDTEGLVILCSSFSKLLSPGLRVGWCAPGRYRNEVERLKMMSTIGTGTIPQLLITEMLRGGGYDRFLRGLRNSFYTQTQKTIAAIGKYFPEGTRVTKPQGGFVLWVELPRGIDSVELARKALQKNISVAPGILFSAKGSFRNFLRISCGQIWTETIDRALLTLGLLARGIA